MPMIKMGQKVGSLKKCIDFRVQDLGIVQRTVLDPKCLAAPSYWCLQSKMRLLSCVSASVQAG